MTGWKQSQHLVFTWEFDHKLRKDNPHVVLIENTNNSNYPRDLKNPDKMSCSIVPWSPCLTSLPECLAHTGRHYNTLHSGHSWPDYWGHTPQPSPGHTQLWLKHNNPPFIQNLVLLGRIVLERKGRSLVVVLEGKGRSLVIVLRGNERVSSISLHNYDQFSFQLSFSIRKTKLVVVLEGNGRNSSISPQNYDQTSSFSL